jgi:hypothetical protein
VVSAKNRTYIEETLQVPGLHRHHCPRPFVIRDADFNRTLSNCSTGARQRLRFCTLRLPSWDSSSRGATTSSRATRRLTRRRESTLRKTGRTPSVFTSTCWRASTLLRVYKVTPKHKHLQRSSRPESDHFWAGAPSPRRRIKSISPPIPEPRCLRLPPGRRGTQTTEVKASRRRPKSKNSNTKSPGPSR